MVMLALQTTSNRRCCSHSRSRRTGASQRKSRLELDCQSGSLIQPRMQLKHKGARQHTGWLRDKPTFVSIAWQITTFLVPGLTKHQ